MARIKGFPMHSKLYKIVPTNAFDHLSLSSSSFPLFHSNYQHCCRFCHFTSKTAFLIESPLSFSSKLPQLSWRLARRSFYLFPFPNFPSSSWWRAGNAGVGVVRFSNPLQCKSGLVDPSAIGNQYLVAIDYLPINRIIPSNRRDNRYPRVIE